MIIHIDMDAFYASVEQRDNPQLIGKPVVVGGSAKGRGVVAAASYEARQFGIHSAMPAARVLRLCSKAVFVKPRMEHYARISKQIRSVFGRFTSLVEPLSLDEAFLDVSGCIGLFGEPPSIAAQIKQAIQDEVGLVASAGVAPNKFLAKLSSDLEKPNGLVVVPANGIQEFLDPLEIARVWGVGKQGARKFASLGVRTIGQLQQLPLPVLRQSFGLNAEHFWRLARGIDTRPVVSDRDAKSVSHETTFAVDIDDRLALQAWLLELTEQVARRLRRYSIRGRTVQLKIRFDDFRTITRSFSMPEATSSTQKLWDVASNILRQALIESEQPIRLLGMGVSNLVSTQLIQRTLFDQCENQREQNIDQTTDAIRDKFGSQSLRTATSLRYHVRHRADPRVDQ